MFRCLPQGSEGARSSSGHQIGREPTKNPEEPLHELRDALAGVVKSDQSVFILIDNLDKAWDSRADLTALSEILLGLMEAAKRLPQDFDDIIRPGSNVPVKLPVRLCVFLRSDIFHRIKQVAREPDKVDASRLQWKDPELLLRVIDERFLASRADGEDVKASWVRFFCGRVRGRSIREYLTCCASSAARFDLSR